MRSDFIGSGFVLSIFFTSIPFGTITNFPLYFIFFNREAVSGDTDIIVSGKMMAVFSTTPAINPAHEPTYCCQYSVPHTSCQVPIIFFLFNQQTTLTEKIGKNGMWSTSI